MASAPNDTVFDEFLSQRGHETASVGWQQNYNKLQCPECMGLHDTDATECSVCGWTPRTV
ncbi:MULTISPECIES: HVO_0416 family zinc finger protein [unclassified Haladaptatus]|uniref:HVO_0416 family zinc finger protein n=1 Tax=unclassified Haladaptatus TaxID=2622732 RepID=UPI0023E86085|nr:MULTISPECIES: HVO_0416 family zinc finger protein [unclassified Haladaptatus]